MSPSSNTWDRIRAALIFAVLAINIGAAMPAPDVVSQQMLEDPEGKAEIDRWVQLLDTIGIDVEPGELGDRVSAFSRGWRSTRRTLLAPFQPWWQLTATWQGWGLFARAREYPFALVIDARREGGDYGEPLYASHLREYRWSASVLHYRRVRASYEPVIEPPLTYERFVDWIAARAFEEDPSIDRVRVRFLRSPVGRPGEEPTREAAERFRMVRARDEVGR